MSEKTVVIVGLGEVGGPLLEILSKTYECVGIDVKPVEFKGSCSVLHVCYPFQIPNFVQTTASYIKKYRPELTIVNSTIRVGTVRQIQDLVDSPVAYSPVRGKHKKMSQDMMHYQKFVAGFDRESTEKAVQHFSKAGFRVATFRSPEVGELSKLLETTWLGILIGWAQDVERMAGECGASYEEVNAFIQEISFLPSHVFPGRIGGHCVMPNIAMLREIFSSKFLDAVVESNQAKEQELSTPANGAPGDRPVQRIG